MESAQRLAWMGGCVEVCINNALTHGMVVYKCCPDVLWTHEFDGTIPSDLITTVVVFGKRKLICHNHRLRNNARMTWWTALMAPGLR